MGLEQQCTHYTVCDTKLAVDLNQHRNRIKGQGGPRQQGSKAAAVD